MASNSMTNTNTRSQMLRIWSGLRAPILQEIPRMMKRIAQVTNERLHTKYFDKMWNLRCNFCSVNHGESVPLTLFIVVDCCGNRR